MKLNKTLMLTGKEGDFGKGDAIAVNRDLENIFVGLQQLNTMAITQTGPTGPQGPAGPTGATGPQGPTGAQGTSAGYHRSFTDLELVAGVLTVTHNLGLKYCQVQVFNNSGKMIVPDDVTLISTNSLSVDISSYGTIIGTWDVVVNAAGTNAFSFNIDGGSPFVIENRTDDPSTPYTGRMWIRTDL